MNVESIFEDLEAQAYFLQSPYEKEEVEHAEVVQVALKDYLSREIYIYHPNLGKDCLAGFTKKGSQHCWYIFPFDKLLTISMPNSATKIPESNFCITNLITNKLIGITLRIGFSDRSPELLGVISSQSKKFLEVQTGESSLLIPKQAFTFLAVENIHQLL